MTNYVLLDDDLKYHHIFKELVTPYIKNNNLCFYNNPEKFKLDIIHNKIDPNVLFLDIDMPNCDGITLSKLLLSNLNGAIIVFLTNRCDLVYEAFGLNVFRFIPKNLFASEIERLFIDIFQYLNTQSVLILENKKYDYHVLLRDILYIEKQNRKCWVISKDYTYSLNYIPLEEVYSSLPSVYFCYINRNTIVNLMNVKKIIGKKIFLVNNNSLDISPSRKLSVLKSFNELMFRIFR